MATTDLSIADKLLIAALKLEQQGQKPFTAEDLVVAAWREFPKEFGLRGHAGEDGRALFPDSNRVFVEIMGSKPVRKRGLLMKVGNKMYQLTESGREHARLVSKRGGESAAPKAGLARQIEQDLKRLMSSKAMDKYREGRIDDLTFYDACAFWGISPRSSAMELSGRVGHFKGIVSAAQKALLGNAVAFRHGGVGYTDDDLNALLALHEELFVKFKEEIQFIQQRTDERV